MRKINYILLALIGLFVITASCNRQKTYAEYLRDESRAIDRFISQNGFILLNRFPSDTIFRENEFFRDPASGVIYSITDRGNLNDSIEFGRDIHVRFSGLRYFMSNDTTLYSNNSTTSSVGPITLTYRGPVSMQNRALYESGVPAFIVSVPMIGHNARVRMIVPFNMGAAYQRQVFQAVFYDEVEYRFDPAWIPSSRE